MTTFEQLAAGIFSTLCMTLFTEAAFALLQRPYHVVRILGNMLRFERTTTVSTVPPPWAIVTANVVHYAIGAGFAIGYNLLFATDDERLLLETLGYGFIIGVIAIIGWRLFFLLHPGPPPVSLPVYLATIGIGHVVLALALYVFVKVL